MSRKILEGSQSLLHVSTHTHAFAKYYVIKHFTVSSREKAWLREAQAWYNLFAHAQDIP